MDPPEGEERDTAFRVEEDSPAPLPVPEPEQPFYRVVFPEIWILIAQQIRPEDVATFAAICRTTYDITRRAHFWFHMYRKHGPRVLRHGAIDGELPMRLRPESMVRLGGLRACVIRTLFFTYQPFIARIEIMSRNLDLTSFTRRLKIRQMWCVQVKDKLWCYYFRLQAPIPPQTSNNSKSSSRFKDVLENRDEGCRILSIESPKSVPLPQTFDQPQQIYLKTVTYNMSHGLRSYKVNLELVTYNGSAFAKVILDPALNIKVWDWWHPAYHKVKDVGQDYVAAVTDDFYYDLF